MGLDMHLTRKTYVQGFNPEKSHEITVKLGGEDHPFIEPARVTQIVEEVAYWRKFNALHRWFVENTQDGEDDCRESRVEVDQLGELLNLLERVAEHLANEEHEAAGELLPPQEGFFFGSTDIDDHYIEDVARSIATLNKILIEAREADRHGIYATYWYHSSW